MTNSSSEERRSNDSQAHAQDLNDNKENLIFPVGFLRERFEVTQRALNRSRHDYQHFQQRRPSDCPDRGYVREIERFELRCSCLALAIESTPSQVTRLRFMPDDGRLYNPMAMWDGTIFLARQPDNPHALYIYLHECAHLSCGHVDTENRCRNLDMEPHLQEKEACMWAIERMREANIPIHPTDLDEATKPEENFKEWPDPIDPDA